jgi:A/G-specific adenine glycosylase
VAEALAQGVGPRAWYYALLDYGAHLKRTLPNPSRRSAHHASQSRFEGSRRQKRAWLLRAVMEDPGATTDMLRSRLSAAELAAGRDRVPAQEVASVLGDLTGDGFLSYDGDGWFVA